MCCILFIILVRMEIITVNVPQPPPHAPEVKQRVVNPFQPVMKEL